MNNTKEVYFNEYCPKCKNYEKSESDDPCWDCLDEPFNVDSHKPLFFDAKEGAHDLDN